MSKSTDFKIGQVISEKNGTTVGIIVEVLQNTICLDSIQQGVTWHHKTGVEGLLHLKQWNLREPRRNQLIQTKEVLKKDTIKVVITYKGQTKEMETDMPVNEEELYGFLHIGDFLWKIGDEVCKIMKLPYPEV